jgi:RNA-directed DNA polymerase
MIRKLIHRKSRNAEYYNQTKFLDGLFKQSKNDIRFYKLYDQVFRPENIRLAYRNIKRNSGSHTVGTDKKCIRHLQSQTVSTLVSTIQKRAENFKPGQVRRVWIPKPNGKQRPIGIPTITDRLIQQCMLQVLEPICEAKFHPHSYGFRPFRSTHHALARAHYLVNKAKLHYVVDVDIQSFFDTIDHGKLLKQLWTLGIRDKKILSVLSKMLKAEILGEGIPTKGTPQGGILSPLLSNICLNELDWWLSSQWESHPTKHAYTQLNKYTALKKTHLKEFYLVRYADDFKIFCRSFETAQRIFEATKQWLENRLNLQVSMEKSKITKLRKKSADFLGVRLKASRKGKKYVCLSRIQPKALKRMGQTLRIAIKAIQKNPNMASVNRFNATVLGMQEYYSCATHCSKDFNRLAYNLSRTLYNRLKKVRSQTGTGSQFYRKRYKGKFQEIFVAKLALFPIATVQHKKLLNFSQDRTPYTLEGRRKLHHTLSEGLTTDLHWIASHPIENESMEYNDNRLSKWTAQKGKCAVLGEYVGTDFDCHHKQPRSQAGTDQSTNLVILSPEIHKLIHATTPETITKYLPSFHLTASQYKRLNQLREQVGLDSIS